MSERRKTLLICVGVGGVFYHGISRLTTFVNRRGLDDVDVLLVDPDRVDERNGGRQWGVKIGVFKVTVAAIILTKYDIYTEVCSSTWQEMYQRESFQEVLKKYAKVIVIHTPDNHECRVQVHEDCADICLTHHIPIIEITGGNTAMDGYAYGCLWEWDEMTVTTLDVIKHDAGIPYKGCAIPHGDWAKRHPDILESAKAEIARREDPHACADMGTEEQTVHSNHLTAHCIWSLAEEMWSQRVVGEYKWMTVNMESPEENVPLYDRIWCKVWDVDGKGGAK